MIKSTVSAVMQVSNQLGNLGAYLEPLIVREPGPDVTDEQIQGDISRLMYIGETYK